MKKWMAIGLVGLSALSNVSQASEQNNLYLGASAIFLDNYTESQAYKFHGGYSFNEHFAIEASYLDFGEETYGSPVGRDAWSANAKGLELIAKYPLGDFAVYGKLGYLWWSEDLDYYELYDDVISERQREYTGSDVTYGFGASYMFFQRVSIRAEYQGISINGKDDHPVSLGFDVHF
ncbi:outer membrane beta-barrel protein [Thalassotalea maritima]|uniref:outer membrane beta-barrel protein n=1 Tax=Thalassotalea maritima TaxID=3242416 RepID=UPI003529CFDF